MANSFYNDVQDDSIKVFDFPKNDSKKQYMSKNEVSNQSPTRTGPSYTSTSINQIKNTDKFQKLRQMRSPDNLKASRLNAGKDNFKNSSKSTRIQK